MAFLLGIKNAVEHCSLSGGAWQATAARDKLKTRDYYEVARTVSAAPADTQFVMDQGWARPVRIVALIAHNLGAYAQWRIRAASDADFTSLQYDSGWMDVWRSPDLAGLDWSWQEWWVNGGRNGRGVRAAQWPANVLHILPANKRAQYWRIEVGDSANRLGYIEAGRVFIGDAFIPHAGMSYGRGLGVETASGVESTAAGLELFRRRVPTRVVRGSLDWLSEAEADLLRGIQLEHDICQELYYVEDASRPERFPLTAFPARFRQLSPIEWPFTTVHKAPFEFRELVAGVPFINA